MAQVISPKKTVEYLRKKNAYDTAFMTDKEVYEYAQNKFPDVEFPVWEDKEKKEIIRSEPTPNLLDVDASPSVFSSLLGFSFIDPENPITGVLIDDDSKYFQDTYNKSMAGLIYQAIEGKQKYNVGDYEPSLPAEIAQFFLGHLAPSDITAFIGSGFLGNKAANYVGKKYLADLGAKGIASNMAKTFPKAPFIADAVARGGISGGIGLGAYGTASSTIAEAAQQSKDINDPLSPRNEFDVQKIILEGVKRGSESAALGAVSAGLVKGSLGTKYAFAKLKGKDKSFMDKVTVAMANPGGQVAAEAAAFTGGEIFFSDEEFSPEHFTRSYFRNLGIIGGLKLLNPGTYRKQSEDMSRLYKQTKEFQKAGEDKGIFENVLNEVQKEVSKNPNSSNLFQEELLLEKITGDQLSLREQLGGQQKLIEVSNKLAKISESLDPIEVQKIINKSVDKGYKSLNKKEKAILKDADYWMQNASSHNNVMHQVYTELYRNPKKYYDLLNKEAKKQGLPVLDKAGQDRALKHLEANIDQSIQFHDYTNAIARGAKPVIYPKGAKFQYWKEMIDNVISGKEVKEVVKEKAPIETIKEKKPTISKQEQINNLVDKLAVELKKTPDQIKSTKEYQTELLDPQGKPYLSLERLEQAYENVLKTKPDTPQSSLAKVLKDVEAEAFANKSLDSKIGKKISIRQYLENSQLSKENKQMALVGFNEFMRARKSGNSPKNYKQLIDFFEYAQKEFGKNINTITNDITNQYIKFKNYNKSQRVLLNNSLSAFYGTGDYAQVQKVNTGFAYSYMGKRGERTPSIAIMGESRAAAPAKLEALATVEPKEYLKIKKVKSDLISKGQVLEGSSKKRKITADTYDAVTEIMYEFGSRGRDTLQRLMIENIDWKNGIIKTWSTGFGQKGRGDRVNVPIKEVIPELWNKLVKVKGNRTEGQLFKTIDGEVLTRNDINKLNKQFLPKDIILGGKKGKLTVQDYRRVITTDASKTGRADIISFVDDFLVGHKQAIKEVYNIKDVPKLWKEFRRFRKGQESISKPIKTLSERAVKAFELKRNRLQESLAEYENLRNEQIKISPDKKTPQMKGVEKKIETIKSNIEKINKKLTPSKLASEAFQRLQDAGSFGTKDFFRKDTPNYTNRQKLQDAMIVGAEVLNQGFKTFKNFSGEMIKRVGDSVKPYLSKLFKQAKDYVKNYLQEPKIGLGIKVLKEKPIKKVDPIKSEVDLKNTRKIFNKTMDKLDVSGNASAKKRMIEYIASLGNIENVENFRKLLQRGKIYENYLDDIAKFNLALKEIDIGKLSKVSDKVKWFSTYKEVERMRLRPEANITQSQLQKDMKRLGVKSGNIWDANLEQLNRYYGLLKSIEFPDVPRDIWLNTEIMHNNLNSKLAAQNPTWVQVKGFTLPFGQFIESIGNKKLALKLEAHSSKELQHIGEGFVSFENDAKNIMSGKIGKITGTSLKWEFAKDQLVWLDQARYKDALKNNLLSKRAKAFIEKALDENWKPRKNKDGTFKTKEAELADRYKDFTKYYVKEFTDALKQVMSEAQHEKFMNSDAVKWIKDGFYVSRVLTKQFKQKYNLNSKHIEEWVNKETLNLAEKEAKKKYKTDKPSNQQINEFLETSESVIRAGIHDLMTLSTTKISSRFLKRRHLKLPERIGNIKVYETAYENTIKVYANSMGKFLANVEFFPEYVSMKGFDYPGVKSELQKLKQTHPKWGDFIREGIERQLGKGKGSPFTLGITATQTIANTLAKFGLSFPTSGLKNLLLGTTQTSMAFEQRDLARGFIKVLNAEQRSSVRATGQTEIGLRHMETGFLDRALDATVFKTGLMKLTENFNRYLAVLTSRVEQQRLANIIRNTKLKEINPKLYEKSMRRFTDFYRLDKEGVKLIEKYGMEGTDGHSFATPYERAVQTRKLNNLYQKMDTMAGVKTQGASIGLFMPEWANKAGIKPFTLYKRMAYAASVNTFDNGKLAFKNGNFMKLAMYNIGTFLTGASLLALYDKVLGSPMPNQHSPWWRQLLTIMWRGEFLGLLSGIFNPRGSLPGVGEIVEPSIVDNSVLLFNKLHEVFENPNILTAKYAAKDYVTRTYNAYNQMSKIWDKKTSPYSVKVDKYRKLYNSYKEDIGSRQNAKWETTELTAFHRELKNKFNKGSESDFAKQFIITVMAKASQYLNEGYSPNIKIRNENDVFQEAVKQTTNMVKSYNPNKGSLDKKDVALKRSMDFITWMSDKIGKDEVAKMMKLETEYINRYDKYMKSIPYHIRKNNIKEYSKYFKIKQKKSSKDRFKLY